MPRGRRPLPWIKLWFEMLNDVKMNRLSAAEKWCWTGILLLAGQPPERGKLLLTETEPMTTGDIASALRLTTEEIPALENCIAKLVALKSLKWNNHCLEVINFKKRQEVYESDLPDNEFTPNLLRNHSVKTPTEGEGRGEKKDTSPDGEDIYSPNSQDGIKKLFDLWNSLGVIRHRKLTGDMTRAIKAASRDFSAAEISQAMKNYAQIVNDERCFFKYKWTLEDFLKRGLRKFLDLEVALKNYGKGGSYGDDKKRPRQLKPRSEYTTPEEWRSREQGSIARAH